MKPQQIIAITLLILFTLALWSCAPQPLPTETAAQAVTEPAAVEEEVTAPSSTEARSAPESEDTETQEADEPAAEPAGEEPSEDTAGEAVEETEETQEEPDEESTAVSAEGADACIDCHTDKQALIDTADPVEELESENEGAG